MLCHRLPDSNDSVRHALYQGTVFLLDPTATSVRLVKEVIACIEE